MAKRIVDAAPATHGAGRIAVIIRFSALALAVIFLAATLHQPARGASARGIIMGEQIRRQRKQTEGEDAPAIDVDGRGKVDSLAKAIAGGNKRLADLVDAFSREKDRVARWALAAEIALVWTETGDAGAEGLDAVARREAAVNTFYADDEIYRRGSLCPTGDDAEKMELLFQDLVRHVYANLCYQTHWRFMDPVMENVMVIMEISPSNTRLGSSSIVRAFRHAYETESPIDRDELRDLLADVSAIDLFGGALYRVSFSRGYAGHMDLIDGDSARHDFEQTLASTGYRYLVGTDADDSLWAGAGNRIVLGGKGDDRLFAGFEDSILYGGPGDDYLEGNGKGCVFVWGKGSGNDTVAVVPARDAEYGDFLRILDTALSEISAEIADGVLTLINTEGERLRILPSRILSKTGNSANISRIYFQKTNAETTWNGLLAAMGLAAAIESPEKDNPTWEADEVFRDATFSPGEMRIDGERRAIYRDNSVAKPGQWVLHRRPRSNTFSKKTVLEALPGGLLVMRKDELRSDGSRIRSLVTVEATKNLPERVVAIGDKNEISKQMMVVGGKAIPVTRVKALDQRHPNLFYVSDALPFGGLVKEINEFRGEETLWLELVDFGGP